MGGAVSASDILARFSAFLLWAALPGKCGAASESFFAVDVEEVADVPVVLVETSGEAWAQSTTQNSGFFICECRIVFLEIINGIVQWKPWICCCLMFHFGHLA